MNEHFRHRIERTANKHSRAVYRDETIVIRLARNLSAREEQEHINALLKRMTSIVLRERKRTIIDPFRPLLEGEQSLKITLASGRAYTFTLVAGQRMRAARVTDGWRIELAPRTRRRQLHRFLWTLLGDLEHEYLEDLVREIDAETFNFGISGLRIGYASSQWGSCSVRGEIMLNAVLLLLPLELLRYVVIHELAHRRVRNHSPAYWRVVASVLPDYAALRRNLSKYRICSL